jgi:hypothetical protein
LAYRKSREPIPVTEDKEQEALKDEQRSSATSNSRSRTPGQDEEQVAPKEEQSSQISSARCHISGGELAPSSAVKRPKWFEKTLKDAQEHVEAPRSTFKENKCNTPNPLNPT